MTVSLLAAMLLAVQPAPQSAPEETVAVETEAQVEAPAPAAVPTPPAPVQVAAQAEAETPPSPEEEVICRRRLRPSERIGQRHRVVNDCRTRAEWDEASGRRPRRAN